MYIFQFSVETCLIIRYDNIRLFSRIVKLRIIKLIQMFYFTIRGTGANSADVNLFRNLTGIVIYRIVL